MRHNQKRKTETGWIIERPTSALKIESAMLGRETDFEYADRSMDNRDEYDTRHVGKYAYPNVWIAGWWGSYYGFVPHIMPTRLLPNYPLHIPWVNVDSFDGAYKQAQRKPIAHARAGSAWWAIEVSTADEPTLEVPDLRLSPPVGESLSQRYAYRKDMVIPEHITQVTLNDAAASLVSQPLELLGAICDRKVPESILAWAYYAAIWSSTDPEFSPPESWTQLVLEFKHDYTMLGGRVPTKLRNIELPIHEGA